MVWWKKSVKVFFLGCLQLYRWIISPLLPRSCRFYPSCSHYAIGCFEKYSLLQAFWLTGKRVLKCHPFHPGGLDLIP